MLNPEKIKDMTQMAIYENGKGQKELAVTAYRRQDYVAMQLVKSFILGTVEALIILVFYFLLHTEILDKLNSLASVKTLVVAVAAFYIIFIAAYMMLTFFWARRGYKRCAANAEAYTQELNRVVRSYQTPGEAEEKKQTDKPGFLKWRR